jgi:hypothetical protein
MPEQQPSPQPVYAIRQYLEREFPDQVRHAGWEPELKSHVFEITHETGSYHQVLIGEGVAQSNRDAVGDLRESELVDYLREARAQTRRFHVRKEGGAVHVRSTRLT